MSRLDRFFDITARGSTVGAEIRGGMVTFIAMAYIIVLNPIILAGPRDVAGNQLQFAQVSAVTALTAGVMTILFGVVARLPFAFAAGLGINSFLATSVVGTCTWPEAMGPCETTSTCRRAAGSAGVPAASGSGCGVAQAASRGASRPAVNEVATHRIARSLRLSRSEARRTGMQTVRAA